MPRKEYKHLTNEFIETVKGKQKTRTDWIQERLEPPPGITKKDIEDLESLSDRDYLKYVLSSDFKDKRKLLMVSETERGRTFRSTWPYNDIVKGEQLAKAGFYSLDSEDRVQCAFCDGVIKQWKKGDRPMEVHRIHYSFCKFVRGKSTTNMPLDVHGVYRLLEKVWFDPNLDERDEDPRQQLVYRSYEELDQSNPKFSEHEARVKSFHSWPAKLQRLVPYLCDAGFYFTDSGDKCACFVCGGTLEDWESMDDPWAEHARWYYKCPFMKTHKGDDYIRRVRDDMSPQNRHESENVLYNIFRKPEQERSILVDDDGYLTHAFIHNKLGYSQDLMAVAYKINDHNQFTNPITFLRCIHDILDGVDPKQIRETIHDENELDFKPLNEEELHQALADGPQ